MAKTGAPTKRRKTLPRVRKTPWLRAIGAAFEDLLEAVGRERRDVPAQKGEVSEFINGGGMSLTLLEAWCQAVEIEPDELFIAAMLKRLPASFPVRVDVQSEAQHLKELAHMLRDPEKQRVLSYLNDMNADETTEMVTKAHDIWKRRHSTARRAVHGP